MLRGQSLDNSFKNFIKDSYQVHLHVVYDILRKLLIHAQFSGTFQRCIIFKLLILTWNYTWKFHLTLR
jgi:hypothetical protein